ncbi:9760_t:CDS:1 [Acaulospora colombiana]|uniref:9760_t:CDS:1 n=1 Tax=Acaulospora colombiana TaxID=27376 RepID=A0ACA9KMM5_9GLOM|nr:9760_t:CDS:1 [Acaulospora colombiana]
MASSLVPLLIITAVYYYYVDEAYDRGSAYIPLMTLRKEEKESQSHSDDVNLAPAPKTMIENEETTQNGDVTPPQSRVRSRRTLENDVYRATPDFYTDYSQPPMTLHDGVLDTGIRNYGAPELYGILPWLWLPVKGTIVNRAKKFGFFRRISRANGSISTRSVGSSLEEREPLLGHDDYDNPNASITINESQIPPAGIPDEVSRLQLRNSVESLRSESSNMASGSGENGQIVGSPLRMDSPSFRDMHDGRRLSRIRELTDKLGEFAGKNFS